MVDWRWLVVVGSIAILGWAFALLFEVLLHSVWKRHDELLMENKKLKNQIYCLEKDLKAARQDVLQEWHEDRGQHLDLKLLQEEQQEMELAAVAEGREPPEISYDLKMMLRWEDELMQWVGC